MVGAALYLAVTALGLMGGGAAAAEPRMSLFAGVLTDNVWEDIVIAPAQVEVQRPGLVGAGLSWPLGAPVETPFGALRFDVEAQIVRHSGLQENWEANLPLTARLRPDWPLPLSSLAFGIGPSHASAPPEFERVRGKGDVARTLIYWHIELGRDLEDGARVFARLHHRSDGYGALGPGGSSNGLVLGLERGF